MIWTGLLGIAASLVVLWLILVGFLLVERPGRGRLAEAIRILPDTLELLRGLLADRAAPPGIRIRLALLFAYLATPIDLIPDFLPGIGWADDAIVVALAVRSIVRTMGPEAIEKRWAGTDEGLETLRRAAGLEGRSRLCSD